MTGNNSIKVGLDHIAFYSPNQCLSLNDLALARGVDPDKFTKGIGISEIAIPYNSEDVVTLAANAGQRVLVEAGISPDEVGMLIVGTESAVDKAKPVATHVHELLKINNSCRVYDIIHACAGATYGVLTAMDWVACRKGGYALVIATDIARYGINTPGEPTQGAGAVAMLISCSPRIMDMKEVAVYSKNVYDFWKPLHEEFPIVKGVYSTQCYLAAVKACYEKIHIDPDSAFLYHSPYPGLVKKAHQVVAKMISKDWDWEKHYDRFVSHTQTLPSKIGNIYTGSLWLSLISLLETIYNQNVVKTMGNEYKNAYLFSYGSGCGSALIQGELSETWVDMAGHFNYFDLLEARDKISVENYEKLIFSEKTEIIFRNSDYSYFRYEGIVKDQRIYKRNERNQNEV
ncbi:MAG: hypothetical protein PF482_18110 [Desulfobacteraceae bacterium]|nr:hypothetical protein [Desulfobacteraceae bacterium]